MNALTLSVTRLCGWQAGYCDKWNFDKVWILLVDVIKNYNGVVNERNCIRKQKNENQINKYKKLTNHDCCTNQFNELRNDIFYSTNYSAGAVQFALLQQI